tara:strand:+ start:244 stop:516 length:273 start_codon:yes stop_codon:yes gene_type:complete
MNNNEWSLWLRKMENAEGYELCLMEHVNGEEEWRYIWHSESVHDALRKAEAVQEEFGDGHLTGVHLADFANEPITSSEDVYADASATAVK